METLEAFLRSDCNIHRIPELFGSGEWERKSYSFQNGSIWWRNSHVFRVMIGGKVYIIEKNEGKISELDNDWLIKKLVSALNDEQYKFVAEAFLDYSFDLTCAGKYLLRFEGRFIEIDPERGMAYIDDKLVAKRHGSTWEAV